MTNNDAIAHATCIPVLEEGLLGFLAGEDGDVSALHFPSSRKTWKDPRPKDAAARALYFQAGLDALFLDATEEGVKDRMLLAGEYAWRHQGHHCRGEIYCCIDPALALPRRHRRVVYHAPAAMPAPARLKTLTIQQLLVYDRFARERSELPQLLDGYADQLGIEQRLRADHVAPPVIVVPAPVLMPPERVVEYQASPDADLCGAPR